MKILVIGGGGREHALIWKLRQSAQVEAIFCAPGNAGIAELADCVAIETSSTVEAAEFAEKARVDLTVVGPELPLTLGVVDEFQKRDLPIFGPTAAAAEIEGSKVFAREFMERHGIPAPSHWSFASFEEAKRFLKSKEVSYPVVLKVDGLAAGKGVVIAADRKEAEAFAAEVLEKRSYGRAGDRLLVEECLEGEEASFFALSDGKRVVPLAACHDYKRALDGDNGPNTGGMGSCSPTPRVNQDGFARILKEIVLPTVSGLQAEGRTYRGLLYAGLMMTSDGPKVLEFNARFGDPETQALAPRLNGDLAAALQAAAAGNLEGVRLEWSREACTSVVLAATGYPEKYETGHAITGIDAAQEMPGVTVFQAGTRRDGDQVVTCGGRVLAVSALGPTLAQATERAYEAVDRVRFEGAAFRRDIGATSAGAVS